MEHAGPLHEAMHHLHASESQVYLLGPFYGATAVPSVTGGVRRLAAANGPNIFQMLLVIIYKHTVMACLLIRLNPNYTKRHSLID